MSSSVRGQLKGRENQTETIKCDTPFDLERVRWKENPVEGRGEVAWRGDEEEVTKLSVFGNQRRETYAMRD